MKTTEHCTVGVKTGWTMEDSLVNREMVEEELGREEFKIKVDKKGLVNVEIMYWHL